LFFTEKEAEAKAAIERLMSLEILENEFPKEVLRSSELLPEEQPKIGDTKNPHRNIKEVERGPAFHEKKLENTKTNQGGSYLRKAKKYKRPQTRGDKNFNRRNKKK
jgi:ATP-dependent RNA helicase RhlE